MYDMYQAAAAASEKFLGPKLFEVRGYYICIYTTVLLIGISPFVSDWGSVAHYVKQKLSDWLRKPGVPSTDTNFNVPYPLLRNRLPSELDLDSFFLKLVS